MFVDLLAWVHFIYKNRHFTRPWLCWVCCLAQDLCDIEILDAVFDEVRFLGVDINPSA
jgi:hypothetical protein